MTFLRSLPEILSFASNRLWQRRYLASCLLAGLTVAVALLSAIPLYAEAVHNRLLQGQLTEEGRQLPPFAFLWRYVGAWNGDVEVDSYRPAHTYFSEQAPGTVGLPLQQEVHHVQTSKMRLFPAPETQAFVSDEPLMWAGVGFVDDLPDQAQLLEGSFPGPGRGEALPVLASQSLADQLGLQAGESYLLFASGDDATQIPLTIAGLWRPQNPADPYWFYPPQAFHDVLLTSPEAFEAIVMPALDAPVSQAIWYQIYDGRRLRADEVPGLLQRVRAVEARATALLEGTTLALSPVTALLRYRREARLLTVLLTVFSIPVVGLVVYFIHLVTGLMVQRDQHEIAVMRSRGSSRAQIVGIYALEGALLGGIGLAAGLFLGHLLARAMGQARTFLGIDPLISPLSIVFTPTAGQYALGGILLAGVALLLPAWQAARHTIVSFKQERARALSPPLWQRAYLDVLLLLPLLYGWYTLRRQGALALPAAGQDPFANPLLFLLPALFCFVCALFFLRLFPRLMAFFSWLAGRLPGVTGLLTLRQLARAAACYRGPLLLLGLTLALAIFTASVARTLDDHLLDQVYYGAGADLRLAEGGENRQAPELNALSGGPAEGEAAPVGPSAGSDGPHFSFLPVEEHLKVDGVLAAARVGDYAATASIGGRQAAGRLMGLDRLDFPAVAAFRPDFAAGEPLGSLMNRLGAGNDHLLVSRDFLARNSLGVGDTLRLTVSALGDAITVPFTVAGGLDLFPTHQPRDGPLFVANLGYVHRRLGGQTPYDVWLATDPAVPVEEIVAGVRALGIDVAGFADAREALRQEQRRPQRQGLLGLLSAGFTGAALLSVLGFVVYAVAGFQRRFVELGMLRAVGLSVPQMAGYLAAEQTIVALGGMGLGTVAGVAASRLFLPFYQASTSASSVPPFQVKIAWDHVAAVYAVFGGTLLLAVLLLLLLLIRMRLHEAVKLAEAV